MDDAPTDEAPRPEPPPISDRDDVVFRAAAIATLVLGIVCASAAFIMWPGPMMAMVPVAAVGTISLALLVIGHVLKR